MQFTFLSSNCCTKSSTGLCWKFSLLKGNQNTVHKQTPWLCTLSHALHYLGGSVQLLNSPKCSSKYRLMNIQHTSGYWVLLPAGLVCLSSFAHTQNLKGWMCAILLGFPFTFNWADCKCSYSLKAEKCIIIPSMDIMVQIICCLATPGRTWELFDVFLSSSVGRQ